MKPNIKRRWDRGVALVLVLSVMALLVVLVLGFFSSVTSETVSSGHHAAASDARRLADSALGMVMSQIRLGTSGSAGVMTWTSQPGLLRTFDDSGQAKEVFKLYSAATLRSDASAYSEDDDGLNDWKNPQWHQALYADINQPVASASSGLVYPIVDPKAQLDDSATGYKAVSGFELGSAPGYDSGGGDTPENNPAAMPVRWLYVLENGQVAVPEDVDDSGNVRFSEKGAAPSRDNPVVGRVAFWTDDDTCKLNLNTAGYGLNTSTYWTYWDTPCCYSSDEEKYLSKNQPWKGEFQRYPGHPATTSLCTVFPNINNRFDLFKIMPRYRAESGSGKAGSDGGTIDSNGSTPLVLKKERLYASVEELLFDPSRNANLPSPISASDIDAKRFFLTTHSRAPELNLFGKPRVTIWPEWDVVSNRTSLDDLLAFCASTSKEQFYFVRHDPLSKSELTLGSNEKLYKYLQGLTGKAIPGFGGPSDGFMSSAKYGSDRDQILTSIFDTIRITNLAEKPPAVPFTSGTTVMGLVVPTEYKGTRGAGRIQCIKEANLVFTSFASSSGTSKIALGIIFDFWQPASGAVAGGADFTYKVEGLESMQIVTGSAASSGTIPLFSGSNNFVSGISSYIYTTSTNSAGEITRSASYTHGTREYRFSAVYGGANPQLCAISGTAMTGEGTSSSCTFDQPLTSDVITLSGGSFRFSGGTITVTIMAPKDSGNIVQKYTFTFPGITSVRIPQAPVASMIWNNTTGRFQKSGGAQVLHQNDVVKSLQLLGTSSGEASMMGDIRLVAQMSVVPAAMYAKPPNYSLDTFGGQYGLRFSSGQSYPYSAYGNLVPGLKPDSAVSQPDIPIGIDGVQMSNGFPGDWDNGYGFLSAGPYLPKPDEGVIYTNNAANSSERGYFYPILLDKAMYEGNLATLFSANRQVPSAGIFGNTPTGVVRGKPWQTLLFRPVHNYLPFGGSTGSHPGAAAPADHLFLDLFTMPVVEPYAISEPFSTAGKVNMNYRIKPFKYIKRDTAVRAVLDSVKMTAIPEDAYTSGYRGYAPFDPYPNPTRFNINPDETLKQFDQRFDSTSGKRVFVSETEICNLDLVPSVSSGTVTLSSLPSFWSNKRTTGDNSLERPYALLYPRLTTKSNTYTVYVTAQSLKNPTAYRNGWNEKAGSVVGEWRGEYTIERYVDPKDPDMPAFFSDTNADLSRFYKFRTLNMKRFAP